MEIILIISALLTINAIGSLISKNKVLTCGIFAWAGSDVSLFNMDKYNILGILNITRGKDSCGVTFDGDAFYGIDKISEYHKFLEVNTIKPTIFPTVIGHTRAASPGNRVTVNNAHPFLFSKSANADFFFGGVHNGTIYNAEKLAAKFGVESKHADGSSKIDSEIVLEILSKGENYEVLSSYNGGAALVWSFFETPNVIYVFKGASKNTMYSHLALEERPLCYYKESKNSLYISSLCTSLEVISGSDIDNIDTFDENTVYIITDGDIENAEKIKVSRDEQTSSREVVSNYTGSSRSAGYYQGRFYEDDDFYTETSTSLKNTGHQSTKSANSVSPNIAHLPHAVVQQQEKVKDEIKLLLPIKNNNLYLENSILSDETGLNKVIFRKLRYYRAGTLVTGIAVYITGFGFYMLKSMNYTEASWEAAKLKGLFFKEGLFIRDEEFYTNKEFNKTLSADVPFKLESTVVLYYFINGVRISTLLDYSSVLNFAEDLDFESFSHMSAHPLINTDVYCDNPPIIMKGDPFTGNIAPIGSERIYNINAGSLVSVSYNTISEDLLNRPIYQETYDNFQNRYRLKCEKSTVNVPSETLVNNHVEEFIEFIEEIDLNCSEKLEDIKEDFEEVAPTTSEKIIKLKKKLNLIKKICTNILTSYN